MKHPKVYVKRPAEVQAIQWTGDNFERCARFVRYEAQLLERVGDDLLIHTLEDGPNDEAKHYATKGDFIIRGIKGEFYPCKPDIFHLTYEEVYPYENN